MTRRVRITSAARRDVYLIAVEIGHRAMPKLR
jgi:hypothetical protein